MAYDASNTGGQDQQVTSSTPLSQGGGTQPSTQPTESGASAPSQPATIQAGANTAAQAAGQAQTSPNKTQSGKASSGMFTNIQKYTQANQGGGARIAGAVQQNLKKQSQVGQTKLANVQKQFQTGMDKASGRAATAAGREKALQDVTAYTQQQAGMTPENELTNFDEETFKDILNKQYSGIQSIRETQGYQDAKSEYDKLQNRLGMAQDPNQTQSLLKNVFGRTARPYTSGASSLDTLFYNTSDQANKMKQSQAFQDIIDSSKTALTDAEVQSGKLLSDRMQAIDKLRTGAQQAFSDVAQQRSGDIEGRLDTVEADWDTMRDYFRDVLRGQTGDIQLSEAEAKTLGLSEADQFFNLTKDENIENLIKSREFERDRLISSKEQENLARLQALSNLAGLEGDYSFKTDYMSDKAGTMSALDALDTENVRNQLNKAMADFRKSAQQDLTGEGWGYDRYKSGFRSKNIKEHRTAKGSLDDILSDAGYQYKQVGSDNKADLDFLKSIADRNYKPTQLTGRVEDYLSGKNWIGSDDPIGDYTKYGGSVIDSAGSIISGLDPTEKLLDSVGLGKLSLGNLTQSLGRMFGSDKGAKIARARQRAQKIANQDLANKLEAQLRNEGFYNKASISQEDLRAEALKNMLGKLDLTNIGEE